MCKGAFIQRIQRSNALTAKIFQSQIFIFKTLIQLLPLNFQL
ncbi:MAG: hypothetical protein OFPII_41540 [Osedax symbiont Rs1]|nr:MAG: hypothetical protein OFPII_41540 [Osedax symbiont Rs1]